MEFVSKEHKELLASKEKVKNELLEKEVKEFFDKYSWLIEESIRDYTFSRYFEVMAPQSFDQHSKEFNKLFKEHVKKTWPNLHLKVFIVKRYYTGGALVVSIPTTLHIKIRKHWWEFWIK
jgi:hypothetical protein